MKHWLAKNKLRYQHGWSWLGAPGMGYLVASQLQEHLAAHGIALSVWWLLPVGILIVWLVGTVSDWMGLLGADSEYNWLRNKRAREMHEKVMGK